MNAVSPDTTDVKVSVVMITYNHDRFIAQAIESVLMQQTDFAVELIIGEDCSTDGTRAIVCDYGNRYPSQIRLLLPERNLGMIPNFVATLNACSGQYVAFLEGDDYWIDPHKLQKQVDFLEAHPECSICAHRVAVVDETGVQSLELPTPKYRREISTIEDLLIYPYIHTCSAVIRNGLVTRFPEWFFTIAMGDVAIFVLNAQHGKIGYIDEVMASYRLQAGGVWSSTSACTRLKNHIQLYDHFHTYLGLKYRRFIRLGKSRIYLQTASITLNEGNVEEAKKLLSKSILSAPLSLRGYWIDQGAMLSRLYTPRLHEIIKRFLVKGQT